MLADRFAKTILFMSLIFSKSLIVLSSLELSNWSLFPYLGDGILLQYQSKTIISIKANAINEKKINDNSFSKKKQLFTKL